MRTASIARRLMLSHRGVSFKIKSCFIRKVKDKRPECLCLLYNCAVIKHQLNIHFFPPFRYSVIFPFLKRTIPLPPFPCAHPINRARWRRRCIYTHKAKDNAWHYYTQTHTHSCQTTTTTCNATVYNARRTL